MGAASSAEKLTEDPPEDDALAPPRLVTRVLGSPLWLLSLLCMPMLLILIVFADFIYCAPLSQLQPGPGCLPRLTRTTAAHPPSPNWPRLMPCALAAAGSRHDA